jgi:dolichol-phosphate mannosyltransferase
MASNLRTLVALPVYNEAKYVRAVLAKVLSIHEHVLVVDDGSTDQTPGLLAGMAVDVVRHGRNRGYGASLRDAFLHASAHRFDWVVTMDCDEQHEPAAIPRFLEAAMEGRADVISGSRYLLAPGPGQAPPAQRRAINLAITQEINARLSSRLGLLTDAFCGFKAYRVASLESLELGEDGYAFPMQFWAQAAARRLRVRELPVRLIYNDPDRSFGAALDDPGVRLAHYRGVLHAELLRLREDLPRAATHGLCVGDGSVTVVGAARDDARGTPCEA